MRQKGSQRVILNANLWQGMIIKMMDGDKVGPEAAEPTRACTSRQLACPGKPHSHIMKEGVMPTAACGSSFAATVPVQQHASTVPLVVVQAGIPCHEH